VHQIRFATLSCLSTPTSTSLPCPPELLQGALYLLYESASGYGLFSVTATDEANQTGDAVQKTYTDLARFGKMVKLAAFSPFTSAANALENVQAIADDKLPKDLQTFLEANLPKAKKADYKLGVQEAALGKEVVEATKIPCVANEYTGELLRGIRMHFTTFVKGMEELDLHKAQLGLAHSFSRSRVQFNVKRVDNMIIQAIALLDTLDKDINTFIMRVREWYGYCFPELVRIVNDNYQYARVALLVRDKALLTEEAIPALVEILADEDKAKQIVEVRKIRLSHHKPAFQRVGGRGDERVPSGDVFPHREPQSGCTHAYAIPTTLSHILTHTYTCLKVVF
jgi:nucleolar protein 56